MQKELLCGNFHEEMQKIKIPKKSETEEEINNNKLIKYKNKTRAFPRIISEFLRRSCKGIT